MGRIVVGVDGSDTSREALRWAIKEAAFRGATLDVVHAWQPPFVGGYPYTAATLDPAVVEHAARHLLDTIVDGEDASALSQPLIKILVCESPARALIEASKGADMVVVGSRGRGGFVGLMLGSVSQQVVHHASCAVVVIPAVD